MSSQSCPPEWQAWEAGTGLCPYCEGMPFEEWMAMCDCFMSVEQWENITDQNAPVCDCPCHQTVQPGLVPCSRCATNPDHSSRSTRVREERP